MCAVYQKHLNFCREKSHKILLLLLKNMFSLYTKWTKKLVEAERNKS